MKTKLGIVALVCVAVFASGCGSSAQNLIVGKWKAGESGLTLTAEFAPGGEAKLNMFGQAIRGTYKVNGDELEWTLNGKTTTMKMKVTATELELTGEGKTITYKRM